MYDFDTEESQENYRKELKVFIETGNVRDFLIIYFALFFEDIFKRFRTAVATLIYYQIHNHLSTTIFHRDKRLI